MLHGRGLDLETRLRELGRGERHVTTPVLVNRDLTEDHLYLTAGDGRWQISGLIDFADSVIGPKELDWHDLRACMFQGKPRPMAAFLSSYHEG